jgi:hypothetical protein
MDPSLLNLAKQMRRDIADVGEYATVRAPSLDLLLGVLIDMGTSDTQRDIHQEAHATVAGRIASFSELAERARK